jgi:septal ring-binding cell division protein DamX
MHKLGALLPVLVAIILIAPTAQAFACDTDEVADCVRSILKTAPVRQVVPPVPRPATVLKGECSADDEDDVKACLRGLKKIPGVGRLDESDPRPHVTAPAKRKPTEKSEPAQASATPVSRSTHTPAAARVEPDGAQERCQKYFPAIGQLVAVPCGE